MKYLSVCSGIEAASAAWHPLGWEAVGFSEIEPFPCAVLAHHYPNVPNFGSLREWRSWPVDALRSADVLVGGTPCQSFSVAGLRRGMDDDRGNLMLQFVELADAIDYLRRDAGLRPLWILWENVPGVFSDRTNGFGALLGGLGGSDTAIVPPPGRSWTDSGVVDGPRRCAAWRVLDAQYFGVAQRRRRVFVLAVGGARKWACADALLPVIDSLHWHPAPRREARKGTAGGAAAGADLGGVPDIAQTLSSRDHKGPSCGRDGLVGNPIAVPVVGPTLSARTRGGGGLGTDAECDGGLIPVVGPDLCPACGEPWDIGWGQWCDLCGHDREDRAQGQAMVFTGDGIVADPIGASEARTYTNEGGNNFRLHNCVGHPVAFDTTQITHRENRSNPQPGDPCHPLAAGAHPPAVAFIQGDCHGPKTEADAPASLRALRDEIGEEAFSQWGLGMLDSIQSEGVLRQALHGSGVRLPTFSRRWMVYHALSREEDHRAGIMQSVRETECAGCASQGWEPPEQLARELGAYLSQLSQPGAQAERLLHDLWKAGEGIGVLREALSAFQEARRPFRMEAQPAHAGMQVRRLTCDEAEFLQGFPRGYTDIRPKGKPTPDGVRYKSLGNSMAVPVMAWIGHRIQAVAQ